MLIERLERSPHAQVRHAGLHEVVLGPGPLRQRVDTNATATIPHCRRMMEEAGNFESFLIAQGVSQAKPRGYNFRDENVYKWLEGVALSLATRTSPALAEAAEHAIGLINATQQPDGYLNTPYTCDKLPRWSDLAMGHEIYTGGTLIEAGIAHRRATGRDTLFRAARKWADLLCGTFGEGRQRGACGHPEIEVALIELYRETGERKYLELAQYFINVRGTQPPVCGGRAYMQDHLPVREQHTAVGHVVRALYLYAGMTDLYLETGEPALLDTLHTLWEDVVRGKLYVTGALGARYNEEDFGEAYELPNERAYCETCGTIAWMRWNRRLFAVSPEARYVDAIEHALYNGFLAGTARDGVTFFYQNPLESHGQHARWAWHRCACCPPNVVRTMAQLPTYLFSVGPRALYVNLYQNATFDGALGGDEAVRLDVRTDYPWDGRVTLTVRSAAQPFDLYLRIPGWCPRVQLSGPVAPEEAPRPESYVRLAGVRPGDTYELALEMPPQALAAHPRVSNNRGAVALRRGPVVYCCEEHDNPGVDLTTVELSLEPDRPDAGLRVEAAPDLLGGVHVLRVPGRAAPPASSDAPLYAAAGPMPPRRPVTLTAIPYGWWANRGPGTMYVWLAAPERSGR